MFRAGVDVRCYIVYYYYILYIIYCTYTIIYLISYLILYSPFPSVLLSSSFPIFLFQYSPLPILFSSSPFTILWFILYVSAFGYPYLYSSSIQSFQTAISWLKESYLPSFPSSSPNIQIFKSSSKNNLTPHVLSEWMVEVCDWYLYVYRVLDSGFRF